MLSKNVRVEGTVCKHIFWVWNRGGGGGGGGGELSDLSETPPEELLVECE